MTWSESFAAGVPYGVAGVALELRDDHDGDLSGHCLCEPLPRRSRYWQAGDPTSDLPVAEPWRPATVIGPAVTRPAGPGATNPTGDTR